jgi:hypothetical protein
LDALNKRIEVNAPVEVVDIPLHPLQGLNLVKQVLIALERGAI